MTEPKQSAVPGCAISGCLIAGGAAILYAFRFEDIKGIYASVVIFGFVAYICFRK